MHILKTQQSSWLTFIKDVSFIKYKISRTISIHSFHILVDLDYLENLRKHSTLRIQFIKKLIFCCCDFLFISSLQFIFYLIVYILCSNIYIYEYWKIVLAIFCQDLRIEKAYSKTLNKPYIERTHQISYSSLLIMECCRYLV